MSFASGCNFDFGSGFGSKSNYEPVNNQAKASCPTFAEQLDNKEKQSQENYSIASDKNDINSVNVSENVEETTKVEEDLETMDMAEERVDTPEMNDNESTFWTACPYCYYMYEYPRLYADCTLRCPNCKRAFQAVVISSPPVDGQEGYFCCWGFLPFGFSVESWEKHKGVASAWMPFSPMFTCPQIVNIVNKKVVGRNSLAPRVYVDAAADDVFVEISGSSESDDHDDWQDDKERTNNNKAENAKAKEGTKTHNRSETRDASVLEMPNKTTREPSRTGAMANPRKQPGIVAKNFEKLDLNVKLSNEPEEPLLRMNQGNGSGRGQDDNIEGIGFFECLDEFLSCLPVLNVVGDDKVVKAAEHNNGCKAG